MSDYEKVDILLVEDNPNDAEMTMRAFKKNKLSNRIYHVADGTAALDFIYGRNDYQDRDVTLRPKIILLDLKLPKVDGLEVLKIIKSDPATKIIPVVMLTSSMEEKDLIESYRLGVNSYIIKPVSFDKFCEAIMEIGLYWLLLNKQS